MTDIKGTNAAVGLSAEISQSLEALWVKYSGDPPSEVRTEIRDGVVTCVLVDAVASFNRRMNGPQADDSLLAVGKPTYAGYKRGAIAAVGEVTGQPVAQFLSSHDVDTDVATEFFTLEPPHTSVPPRSKAATANRTTLDTERWVDEGGSLKSGAVAPPLAIRRRLGANLRRRKS